MLRHAISFLVSREQNDDTVDRDVSSDTALDSERGQTLVHDDGPQQPEPATQDNVHAAESDDIVSGMAQTSPLDESPNLADALSPPSPDLSNMPLHEEGHFDVISDFGHQLCHETGRNNNVLIKRL